MSNKPIFVATHPRSCSTAFERVLLLAASLVLEADPTPGLHDSTRLHSMHSRTFRRRVLLWPREDEFEI